MEISETVLILAGGIVVVSILYGIRLAMRAAGGAAKAPQSDGAEASAAGGSGVADVAGVIALPPLIFLRFLVAATVLEAIVPLPFLAAHALARYLAGAALAAGGVVMIGMATPRFLAPGTKIPPYRPRAGAPADDIFVPGANPPYVGRCFVL